MHFAQQFTTAYIEIIDTNNQKLHNTSFISNTKPSMKKNASNHSMDDRSSSRSLAFAGDKKVVLVKGIFQIDPRLNFMPDWM